MKYFDQHVHSSFSFDSHASLAEYLRKAQKMGLEYFVVTDHFDLDYLTPGHDVTFDVKARHKKIQELQKQFPNIKIMEGVELGYTRGNLKRMQDFINENNFSLINLSIHTFDKIIFYDMEHFVDNPREVVQLYLDLVYEVMTSGIDFDVLCHIDFAYKTARYVIPDLQISEFEESLKRIFKQLIEMDKCLELNVKCAIYINDIEQTKRFLTLYKELGGKHLNITSDAHKVGRLCDHFDEYIALAKECGFDELCYFVDRKRYTYKI